MKIRQLAILFFPLFFLCPNTFAQSIKTEPGSLNYLDYKNGFKSIILGSEISTFSDKLKLLQKKPDSTEVYSYIDKSDFKVGESTLDGILLIGYKGRVLSIFVLFQKGSGNSIYSIFREAYGIYTEKPNQFMNKYNWDATNVRLSFDYENDNEKPTALFTDKLLAIKFEKSNKEKNKKAIDNL